MNQSQKKLILMWFLLLLFMGFTIVNHVWVLERWDWLQLPLFFAAMMASLWGGSEAKGWGRPGFKLVEFIESYPALKAWVILYSLFILVFIAYGLSKGIEFQKSPGTWLLWGVTPLLLPLFKVSEYQRYKRLGNASKNME